MAYFPMFVDMTERECLIVGGGNVAYRKVIVMLDFGAKVTVVAEDICDELRKLIKRAHIRQIKKTIRRTRMQQIELRS